MTQIKKKQNDFRCGDSVGAYGITFAKEMPKEKNKNSVALFRCHCGKTYIAQITRIKNGYQQSCGCLNGNSSLGGKVKKRDWVDNTMCQLTSSSII